MNEQRKSGFAVGKEPAVLVPIRNFLKFGFSQLDWFWFGQRTDEPFNNFPVPLIGGTSKKSAQTLSD